MSEKEVKFKGFNGNELNGFFSQNNGPIGILFCHGLTADEKSFADFPRKLAEHGYNVLTFDYSGHGKSQGTKGLFTQESHQEDTLRAIDFLIKAGSSKIAVLGHSLGTYPALLSLKEKNVIAAILVCPSRKSGDNLSFYKRILIWLIGHFYQVFGRFVKKEIYFKNINLRFLAYALKINNLKLLKKTKKPILIVAAKKDRDIILKKSLYLYKNVDSGKKELIILEKSGHNPFFGPDKDLLLNNIDKFIKAVI
jgi:esterase/lipase